MALCLAIYCLHMSGCMQLPEMRPFGSSPLQSEYRVSMAIACPGLYDACLLNAVLRFQIACTLSWLVTSCVHNVFYSVVEKAVRSSVCVFVVVDKASRSGVRKLVGVAAR